MTPIEKLDATTTNESIKLTANLLNALSAGTFVGGVVAPMITSMRVEPFWTLLVVLTGVLLHSLGWLILSNLKPQE